MFVHIAGTGSYLPEKVLTNDELAKTLDTSDEWIFSHTGIHSRHIAADGEETSDMAVKAAARALAAAGVAPEELGGVIVATSTGDYRSFPATASLVQARIGASNAGAFDLQAACSGFLYAVRAAQGMMQLDPRPVLVVGAEAMSRLLDWTDRNICILFGDGAGAAVLKASDEEGGILDSILGSDGGAVPPVISCSGGTKACPEDPPGGKLHMNGRAVFNFAVKIFDDTIRRMLERHGLAFDDLSLIVAHQANARIIEAAARRMKQPAEKFFLNMNTVGNTSAASVPIALDEAVKAGRIRKGGLLASVAFGAGLSYGGLLIRW